MIAALAAETRDLLEQQQTLLRSLSRQLANSGDLKAEVTAEIANQHGLAVTVKEEGFLYVPEYDRLLEG
jgi:hypothetical protein